MYSIYKSNFKKDNQGALDNIGNSNDIMIVQPITQ